MSGLEIQQVLERLSEVFETRRKGSYKPEEITIECNPGTLTKEKLQGYREAGVNRLSMGLQSENEEDLKTLGRIHSRSEERRVGKR